MKLLNALILSHLLFESVTGRKTTGGGGSYGSRPRPSYPRPTTPASRPTTPSTRPRDDFASGFKPSSTQVSSKNPNPAYKPTNTVNNAPTLQNGGGGYYYDRGPGGYGVGSLFFAGASGFLLGSFLYGGYRTSPSCRTYSYSGYGNGCYGQSTTAHQCKSQIPMCPIPDSIRSQWYTGDKVGLGLRFENQTCTISGFDFGQEATAVARSDINGTGNETASVLKLSECMAKVVEDGTCWNKRFTYDELTGRCGCCGPQISDWDKTSAIYEFFTESPLERYGAPTHCISNSTLFWPRKVSDSDSVSGLTGAVSGGGNFVDDFHDCVCGSCKTCGAADVRFMDWTGPFAVPEALGYIDAANDKPSFDPVDSCICDEPNPDCSFTPSFNSPASWMSSAVAISSSLLLSLVVLA
mmetsp:Transcript_1369/g.1820  ORF Transcript_1369/g.1820 Transcript_1369/m.1820 type:complete len:409 (+) Transcript_1369:99-1325(+)|eukprot:CAMPEP_0178918844 /NCGR_PEP_ID=MMETSP0786-20121207/14064_1 /TAXON_ID=186022 /ORGANISM="Thalassionema frauenfeldii, Strain CCMP 1798" /LENGTH=408 /DNA_ID=CAMNT_0020592623 /DNA_START=85 /DNA_END=1311 /DNA_ORIENTATION=-